MSSAAGDSDLNRRRAVETHGLAWTLLEKAGRTAEETARMIGAAHASLEAWQTAGGPVETQRGTWLVARAYVAAGLSEPALEFARRTMDLTRAHQAALADFDLAFAKEIAARAWALAGDLTRARQHYEGARKLGLEIVDEHDRKEFFRQFALGRGSGQRLRLDQTAVVVEAVDLVALHADDLVAAERIHVALGSVDINVRPDREGEAAEKATLAVERR